MRFLTLAVTLVLSVLAHVAANPALQPAASARRPQLQALESGCHSMVADSDATQLAEATSPSDAQGLQTAEIGDESGYSGGDSSPDAAANATRRSTLWLDRHIHQLIGTLKRSVLRKPAAPTHSIEEAIQQNEDSLHPQNVSTALARDVVSFIVELASLPRSHPKLAALAVSLVSLLLLCRILLSPFGGSLVRQSTLSRSVELGRRPGVGLIHTAFVELA